MPIYSGGQPHLIRFMDAATPVAVSAVQYVLTDVSDTPLALQYARWAPILDQLARTAYGRYPLCPGQY